MIQPGARNSFQYLNSHRELISPPHCVLIAKGVIEIMQVLAEMTAEDGGQDTAGSAGRMGSDTEFTTQNLIIYHGSYLFTVICWLAVKLPTSQTDGANKHHNNAL